MSDLTKGWLVGILPSVCRAPAEVARACARPHSHTLYEPRPTWGIKSTRESGLTQQKAEPMVAAGA